MLFRYVVLLVHVSLESGKDTTLFDEIVPRSPLDIHHAVIGYTI